MNNHPDWRTELKPGQKVITTSQIITMREDGNLDVASHQLIEQLNEATGEVTWEKDPGLTQQQWKDECDVNKIMEQMYKTGSLTHIRNQQTGAYADLTDLPDYQTSLNTIIKANETFEALPAEIRTRFKNDPAELIAFIDDEKNIEESYKLGLRVRPKHIVTNANQTQTNANQTQTTPDAQQPPQTLPNKT